MTALTSCLRPLLAALALSVLPPAFAAEFSVTPIRVDFAGGAMTETITVTNDNDKPLHLAVKLAKWTQDAQGADVYEDSADLIYFPRQLEIEPGGKRLIRVGAKARGGTVERTYRLYIEEQPDVNPAGGQARLAFLFRFGVPIFVAPAAPRAVPDVAEPVLEHGKVSVVVRNPGNANFRLNRVAVTNGAAFTKEATGWYSLAGSTRTYTLDLPPDVCRQGGTLNLLLEGEKVKVERLLHVDPARCT